MHTFLRAVLRKWSISSKEIKYTRVKPNHLKNAKNLKSRRDIAPNEPICIGDTVSYEWLCQYLPCNSTGQLDFLATTVRPLIVIYPNEKLDSSSNDPQIEEDTKNCSNHNNGGFEKRLSPDLRVRMHWFSGPITGFCEPTENGMYRSRYIQEKKKEQSQDMCDHPDQNPTKNMASVMATSLRHKTLSQSPQSSQSSHSLNSPCYSRLNRASNVKKLNRTYPFPSLWDEICSNWQNLGLLQINRVESTHEADSETRGQPSLQSPETNLNSRLICFSSSSSCATLLVQPGASQTTAEFKSPIQIPPLTELLHSHLFLFLMKLENLSPKEQFLWRHWLVIEFLFPIESKSIESDPKEYNQVEHSSSVHTIGLESNSLKHFSLVRASFEYPTLALKQILYKMQAVYSNSVQRNWRTLTDPANQRCSTQPMSETNVNTNANGVSITASQAIDGRHLNKSAILWLDWKSPSLTSQHIVAAVKVKPIALESFAFDENPPIKSVFPVNNYVFGAGLCTQRDVQLLQEGEGRNDQIFVSSAVLKSTQYLSWLSANCTQSKSSVQVTTTRQNKSPVETTANQERWLWPIESNESIELPVIAESVGLEKNSLPMAQVSYCRILICTGDIGMNDHGKSNDQMIVVGYAHIPLSLLCASDAIDDIVDMFVPLYSNGRSITLRVKMHLCPIYSVCVEKVQVGVTKDHSDQFDSIDSLNSIFRTSGFSAPIGKENEILPILHETPQSENSNLFHFSEQSAEKTANLSPFVQIDCSKDKYWLDLARSNIAGTFNFSQLTGAAAVQVPSTIRSSLHPFSESKIANKTDRQVVWYAQNPQSVCFCNEATIRIQILGCDSRALFPHCETTISLQSPFSSLSNRAIKLSDNLVQLNSKSWCLVLRNKEKIFTDTSCIPNWYSLDYDVLEEINPNDLSAPENMTIDIRVSTLGFCLENHDYNQNVEFRQNTKASVNYFEAFKPGMQVRSPFGCGTLLILSTGGCVIDMDEMIVKLPMEMLSSIESLLEAQNDQELESQSEGILQDISQSF